MIPRFTIDGVSTGDRHDQGAVGVFNTAMFRMAPDALRANSIIRKETMFLCLAAHAHTFSTARHDAVLEGIEDRVCMLRG